MINIDCSSIPGESSAWLDKKGRLLESLFCDYYLKTHMLSCIRGTFFTTDGILTDQNKLESDILRLIWPYVSTGVASKIRSIIELLKVFASTEELKPKSDRIHFANGTLFLNGPFIADKNEVVLNRLPVLYNPYAVQPVAWLSFLEQLLEPEDILTLQEFMGYCLIPTNAGQKMLIIKGNGGEGKSQIGTVLFTMLGCNAKDGSVAKISGNRFARADLENMLLMIDDDMRMNALKETNYVKSIVTAKGRMDLERKGVQSYQGWMYARIMAFSNGTLQSLYDKSDGFYRRQLLLTTKDKPENRVDDPHLSDKLIAEIEGILLWAIEGLKRLIANDFRFTVSDRAKNNLEAARVDANNLISFLAATEFVAYGSDLSVSSEELYNAYTLWCSDNLEEPMPKKAFSGWLISNEKKYNISHTNNITAGNGRRVRGFVGIAPVGPPSSPF